MEQREKEQARTDFRYALTGMAIAMVALAIIMGTAAWLAMH